MKQIGDWYCPRCLDRLVIDAECFCEIPTNEDRFSDPLLARGYTFDQIERERLNHNPPRTRQRADHPRKKSKQIVGWVKQRAYLGKIGWFFIAPKDQGGYLTRRFDTYAQLQNHCQEKGWIALDHTKRDGQMPNAVERIAFG